MVLARAQLIRHEDRLVGGLLGMHGRSELERPPGLKSEDVISSCSGGPPMIQIHPYLGHQFIDHCREDFTRLDLSSLHLPSCPAASMGQYGMMLKSPGPGFGRPRF